MFVSFEDDPSPPRWEPRPKPRPRLSPRDGKVLGWLIGANLLFLLFAPLAGASLVQAMVALFHL